MFLLTWSRLSRLNPGDEKKCRGNLMTTKNDKIAVETEKAPAEM